MQISNQKEREKEKVERRLCFDKLRKKEMINKERSTYRRERQKQRKREKEIKSIEAEKCRKMENSMSWKS